MGGIHRETHVYIYIYANIYIYIYTNSGTENRSYCTVLSFGEGFQSVRSVPISEDGNPLPLTIKTPYPSNVKYHLQISV